MSEANYFTIYPKQGEDFSMTPNAWEDAGICHIVWLKRPPHAGSVKIMFFGSYSAVPIAFFSYDVNWLNNEIPWV